MRKRILPFIMIMLMIFTALPISASASTLYYGKTINSGETYTDTSFEMWGWYGNETFTNNGTVNISNGFTLGYQASFVNNSEFTFTGSNSTFGVSSGCSFQNNGTARISGCYNLGLEDSFVNTGTLYLSDISNFNVSGVVNTGKIVCGNGVPDRLIDALKEKSSGDGTVVKEGESTLSTSTRYTITYDGNPPARFSRLLIRVTSHQLSQQLVGLLPAIVDRFPGQAQPLADLPVCQLQEPVHQEDVPEPFGERG